MSAPSPPTDAARFERLYREHYAAVLRFAARRTSPVEAEEVAADTFATAWQRLDKVPREALPWLLVTARNTLSNRRRSLERADAKTRAHAAEPMTPATDLADALAERDAFARAFAALAEPDREALRLVAWDGLSLADGARVAGTNRVAFAARVSRARRRLAAALDAPATTRTMEHAL